MQLSSFCCLSKRSAVGTGILVEIEVLGRDCGSGLERIRFEEVMVVS